MATKTNHLHSNWYWSWSPTMFFGGREQRYSYTIEARKKKRDYYNPDFCFWLGQWRRSNKGFFSSFFVTFTTFLAPPFCGRGSRKQDVAISRAQTTECKLRAVIANYEFLLLTQSVSALFYYFTRVFHFDEIFFNIFAKTLNHL